MNILVVTAGGLTPEIRKAFAALNQRKGDMAFLEDTYLSGVEAIAETMQVGFERIHMVISTYNYETTEAEIGLMGEGVKKAGIPWIVVPEIELEADEISFLNKKGVTNLWIKDIHEQKDLLEMVNRGRKEK